MEDRETQACILERKMTGWGPQPRHCRDNLSVLEDIALDTFWNSERTVEKKTPEPQQDHIGSDDVRY